MKLAFNGQAHYTDFASGYDLYKKRSKAGRSFSEREYRRVIRTYCRLLADSLVKNGIVDFPGELGSVVAAVITRKAQYRGKKFIGYGGWDYKNKCYDGKLKTFGMVYLPRQKKNDNLRSFGFVANRQLFRRMKERFQDSLCPWTPITFEKEMI